MQKGLHPAYGPVAFRDANTGAVFVTRSTLQPAETTVVDGVEYPLVTVEISSDSHPFWTGQARVNDAEGRVAAFERRYGVARASGSGARPANSSSQDGSSSQGSDA